MTTTRATRCGGPTGHSPGNRSRAWRPGTYYWQVETSTSNILADSGTWWPFTVGTPTVSFGKQTPGGGAVITTNAATLTWNTATGAQFYETCIDTTNNGQCDTSWNLAGVTNSITLAGLTDGTYYWQVRAQTANGITQADAGAWFALTVDAPDPVREYIYLGSKLLAEITLSTTTPVVTYYHTDVLGSVRAVTDGSGNEVSRTDYLPFGEGGALAGDPRKFTGKERDGETAFDYFDARYYRANLGRFTTTDPNLAAAYVMTPERFNRYVYALDNPLRFTDPSGREVQILDQEALEIIRLGLPLELREFVADADGNGLIDKKLINEALVKQPGLATTDLNFQGLLALVNSSKRVVVGATTDFNYYDPQTKETIVNRFYQNDTGSHLGQFLPPRNGWDKVDPIRKATAVGDTSDKHMEVWVWAKGPHPASTMAEELYIHALHYLKNEKWDHETDKYGVRTADGLINKEAVAVQERTQKVKK